MAYNQVAWLDIQFQGHLFNSKEEEEEEEEKEEEKRRSEKRLGREKYEEYEAYVEVVETLGEEEKKLEYRSTQIHSFSPLIKKNKGTNP